MKKIIPVFTGILLSVFSIYSQPIVRVENAKYFDANHNLYNGTYIENYENGNKKLEMFLKNGEKDSTTLIYYEDGKLKEMLSFKMGLMHGRWESCNQMGIKTSEAFYTNDKKDGTWKIWNDQGKLIYEMHYKNGEKCGRWIIYKPTGEILNERTYTLSCGE